MTVVYNIFVLTHHIYYYININYKLFYRATLENVEKFEKWFYAINQENKIKSNLSIVYFVVFLFCLSSNKAQYNNTKVNVHF